MLRSFVAMLNLRRDDSGAAIIEMSVVFPVILAIGLGVIEFGNALYANHLITNGVRDAARYASGLPAGSADDNVKCIALTGGIDTGSVASGGCDASANPSCTAGCRLSWRNDASVLPMVTVSYSCVDNQEVVAGCDSVDFGTDADGNAITSLRGGDSLTMVTVSATVPYVSLGFLGFLKPKALVLHGSHEERVIGVR